MAGSPWSKTEEDVLKHLVNSGVHPYEIPGIIKNRSLSSIHNKMYSMGLKVKEGELDIDWQVFELVTDVKQSEVLREGLNEI